MFRGFFSATRQNHKIIIKNSKIIVHLDPGRAPHSDLSSPAVNPAEVLRVDEPQVGSTDRAMLHGWMGCIVFTAAPDRQTTRLRGGSHNSTSPLHRPA